MKIRIDGKPFTKDEQDEWKRKRVKKVLKNLNKRLADEEDADVLCERLTEIKLSMSYEEIVSCIRVKLALGRIRMKLAAMLSGKKRRTSVTTIFSQGITVEALSGIIDALMMEDCAVYRRVNLGVYPDHYALIPHGDTLEVIETAGNTPVPTQFFITFQDETGIQEPRDLSYPFQSAGVARLKDGTVIGGVRHQFRNTAAGIEVRTLVEFPGICPQTIVKAHEKHLAVEWSNWIKWAVEHQHRFSHENR